MIETLGDIEFETRMVGPMVLTTPVLQRLGLAEPVFDTRFQFEVTQNRL